MGGSGSKLAKEDATAVKTAKTKKETSLSLAGKGLKAFPNEVLSIVTLTSLDLTNNQIKVIPPTISKLKNLKVLILSNNQIEVLPKQLAGLKDLERLLLKDNKFQSLPPVLGELPKLTQLVLEDNKEMKAMDGAIFKAMAGSLKQLSLSGVPFRIPPGDLFECALLTHFVANGSGLLDLTAFARLAALTTLIVANNSISELPVGLANVKSLTNIQVSGNKIDEVPAEFANKTPALTAFEIGGNPLTKHPEDLRGPGKGMALLAYIRDPNASPPPSAAAKPDDAAGVGLGASPPTKAAAGPANKSSPAAAPTVAATVTTDAGEKGAKNSKPKEDGKAADAKPGDAKPADGKAADGKPADAKPEDKAAATGAAPPKPAPPPSKDAPAATAEAGKADNKDTAKPAEPASKAAPQVVPSGNNPALPPPTPVVASPPPAESPPAASRVDDSRDEGHHDDEDRYYDERYPEDDRYHDRERYYEEDRYRDEYNPRDRRSSRADDVRDDGARYTYKDGYKFRDDRDNRADRAPPNIGSGTFIDRSNIRGRSRSPPRSRPMYESPFPGPAPRVSRDSSPNRGYSITSRDLSPNRGYTAGSTFDSRSSVYGNPHLAPPPPPSTYRPTMNTSRAGSPPRARARSLSPPRVTFSAPSYNPSPPRPVHGSIAGGRMPSLAKFPTPRIVANTYDAASRRKRLASPERTAYNAPAPSTVLTASIGPSRAYKAPSSLMSNPVASTMTPQRRSPPRARYSPPRARSPNSSYAGARAVTGTALLGSMSATRPDFTSNSMSRGVPTKFFSSPPRQMKSTEIRGKVNMFPVDTPSSRPNINSKRKATGNAFLSGRDSPTRLPQFRARNLLDDPFALNGTGMPGASRPRSPSPGRDRNRERGRSPTRRSGVAPRHSSLSPPPRGGTDMRNTSPRRRVSSRLDGRLDDNPLGSSLRL